jgi:hypothetical protein
MRTAHPFPFLVGVLFLLIFASHARTAPALGDKPVKYEYAELTFARAPSLPARGKGGLGGGPVAVPVRWTTGDEEIEVEEWSELADKLKAPTPKKESPQGVHKIRVLNTLSADGWEMMDQPLTDTRLAGVMGWSFRRRLP